MGRALTEAEYEEMHILKEICANLFDEVDFFMFEDAIEVDFFMQRIKYLYKQRDGFVGMPTPAYFPFK